MRIPTSVRLHLTGFRRVVVWGVIVAALTVALIQAPTPWAAAAGSDTHNTIPDLPNSIFLPLV